MSGNYQIRWKSDDYQMMSVILNPVLTLIIWPSCDSSQISIWSDGSQMIIIWWVSCYFQLWPWSSDRHLTQVRCPFGQMKVRWSSYDECHATYSSDIDHQTIMWLKSDAHRWLHLSKATTKLSASQFWRPLTYNRRGEQYHLGGMWSPLIQYMQL